MTTTWEILRFEIGYQARRPSTRLYFVIFVALAAAVARLFLNDAREDGYFFNAPIIISAVTIISSMVALLVTAGVAGDAATRDAQLRIDAFLFTTPLRKAAYLGGRFLASFAIAALLLLGVPLGLLITMQTVEPQLLGPFRAEAYLTSYGFFAVPNALVSTAVLFSIAALTRRAIAAYAGAALLFFTAFFSETLLAERLGEWGPGKLLDPLGYTTLRELWRTTNAIQRNTLLVDLGGDLLANRLLWLGVGAGVLALGYARVRLDHAQADRRSGPRKRPLSTPPPATVAVPHPRRSFGGATRVRQLLEVIRHSCRELITSRGWWIVPISAALFINIAPELLEVELGTPGAATAARVASLLGASEHMMLIVLLIAIYAGELVWRERESRLDAIADTVPVPKWVTLAGKFAALALMIAAAQAVLAASGMGVQMMQGTFDFEPAMYARILFGFQLAKYLLFAALAMVIHVVVNQKYVGNVLVMLAFVGIPAAQELGVEHNLLLYGSAPEWWYSEVAGFLQAGPWLWFNFYWSGWALLFVVLSHLFWIRGQELGVRRRLALARRRLGRGAAAIGAVAVSIILGAGGFVFYNTNVLNRHRTEAEIEERRAEYERRYSRYAKLAQPALAATKLHVEFHPDRGAATVRGQYRLENRTTASIDAIHVVTNTDVETTGVAFDRPSRLRLRDDDLGYRIYALSRPVLPGQSIAMQFRVDFAPRGFGNDGRNQSVARNGSWIQHRADQGHSARQWLPFIGYQTSGELDIAADRQRHGLPPRPAIRPLHDRAGRYEQRGREKIAFEAIVGTDASQVAVAPGALRRTWIENGRRYFHYVADAPIRNGYAIFSARYARHEARWGNVAIEILHHPEHTANLERMVRSVRASLDYNTRHFGPYPHGQVRLVEYPSSASGLRLTAYPGMITYSEGFALVRPDDDPRRIDLPFAVVAHEMGHQWWGHRLVAAPVEGSPILSESLAWYSGMLTVEKTLGRDHLMRLLDVMRSQYLAPHEPREAPLLRAYTTMDAYRTGPFVMFALREAIGEARVNAALRNLLSRFDPRRPPYPTSLDLYAEIRAVTPSGMRDLLKDLFEEILFWDLRAKNVTAQRHAGGGWRVALQVEAQKLKGDGTGKERPVPMDDPVEVVVYDERGTEMHRGRHRIRSGTQTITLAVPRRPARVAIDPDHELLDRKPADNDWRAPQ